MPDSTSSYSIESANTRTRGSPSSGGCLAVKRALRKERDIKKNLSLKYKYYEFFVNSQWIPNWLLLLLRCLMGGTCISVFIYVSVQSSNKDSSSTSTETATSSHSPTASSSSSTSYFYLAYLTIWSYLMMTLYFTCALVNTILLCVCSSGCCSIAAGESFSLTDCGYKTADQLKAVRKRSELKRALDSVARQSGFRLQWLLHTIATDAALLVTVAYFSLLYENSSPIAALDLLEHGINSVFMFIEAFFGGVPVRFVNIIYAVCYAVVYVLFSVFYWLSDRNNVIYLYLDWNNPGLTTGVVFGLILIGMPLVHAVWWGIHLLRCYIGGVLLHRENKCSPTLETENA
ncbi:hypothetical protein BOX15_Mlig007025g2 [Macrostomum lignano]|uniref:Uncharacterized protein n=1 Tax=Macrostomum lignano TaxID=282301 RepID=A0A267FLZ5_9PLAT|nr:hypothetical protein BOX15_Mlig007025g2 [Macrostomum lignano]